MRTTPENLPASAMSLRDYLAADAMAALIARHDTSALDDIATTAYAMADAMLEARANHPTVWPRLHTNTDFARD